MTTLNNIKEHINRTFNIVLPPKFKEHIIDDLLKDVRKSKANDNPDENNNNISLSQTRGKPLTVYFEKPEKKNESQLSAKNLFQMQTDLSLSSKTMHKLAKNLRTVHHQNHENLLKKILKTN